jgi:hypothetical protein
MDSVGREQSLQTLRREARQVSASAYDLNNRSTGKITSAEVPTPRSLKS